MRLDKFSNPIYSEADLFDILYQGNITSLPNLIVDSNSNSNFENFENVSGLTLTKVNPLLEAIEIADFDSAMQSDWFMPEEYKSFDIKQYCIDKCKSDIEINRVNEEFEEYENRNMIPILQWLKYFVDTCIEHNVFWGVGRGSSVASYVLYIIGVHEIDSLKYNLDWREFLR